MLPTYIRKELIQIFANVSWGPDQAFFLVRKEEQNKKNKEINIVFKEVT